MKIGKIWPLVILLIVSVGVRLPGLFSRSIWYDESITMLETAGNAQPTWPQVPVPVNIAKNQFIGTPSLSEIAIDLRKTDIHPPVYFWLLSLWRRRLGYSLEAARGFSLVCSTGAVLALYLLLKVGKFKYPIIPSLIFAISSGAVFAGQEARAYALSSLLIVMSALFAYLAVAANENHFQLAVYSIGMALCCGLAFQTNYLALLPLLVILLWVTINLWSVSKLVAILAPLAAISIWFIGFSTLLPQLSARSSQVPGFIGFLSEIKTILNANLSIIWSGTQPGLKLIFTGISLILIGASTIYIVRHWSEINRKLLLLLLGLAWAPSVEIFLLDLLSTKHLAITNRYFIFAGPAFAVLLAYGNTKRLINKSLLIALIGIQLVVINWGVEISPGWPGSNLRSLASTIKDDSSQSKIVVIGAGFGRGSVGSVIYELDSKEVIIVIDNNSNLDTLQTSIQNYDDIWIVPSSDNQTAMIENEILNRLQESGLYANKSQQQSATHLWK